MVVADLNSLGIFQIPYKEPRQMSRLRRASVIKQAKEYSSSQLGMESDHSGKTAYLILKDPGQGEPKTSLRD